MFKVKQFTWYDYGPLLARGGFYNYVVGGRGVGKTYGAKKLCIDEYLESGAQFIYIRRNLTELNMRGTFFNDIKHEYPNYLFRVEGMEGQICLEPEMAKKEWKTICYFEGLSVAHKRKSIPYPDVRTIIFDEFVAEKGVSHYLQNEFKLFNDFYNTVDRFQDRVKVLFLANAVTIDNPYFIAIGIDANKEFARYSNGYVVVNIVKAEEYANEVTESKFGQFIANTDYYAYAVNNEFADNHNKLLEDKPPTARYHMTIESPDGHFSVWHDSKSGLIFCHHSRPKLENIAVLSSELMREGVIYLTRSDDLIRSLISAYRRDRVRFSKPQVRNRFQDLMRNYG